MRASELEDVRLGAIRGGKGLFITADDRPKATGQQLDMAPAQRLLEQALQQSQALAETAKAAQALAADCERQQALLERQPQATARRRLARQRPRRLSPWCLARTCKPARRTISSATAGGSADISVMKRFTVAAGDAVSLFAQKLGMKLFAARGKVEIQAQGDEIAVGGAQGRDH